MVQQIRKIFTIQRLFVWKRDEGQGGGELVTGGGVSG